MASHHAWTGTGTGLGPPKNESALIEEPEDVPLEGNGMLIFGGSESETPSDEGD